MSLSPNKRIRVGLVGAGVIGQLRAKAIAQMPSLRLVAVADRDIALAEQVAASSDDARALTDGGALAESGDVDAVVISTPPVSHESLGVACLAAGKHVLCEKPLATTVAACQSLVDTARDRGVCLATGFTLRHTPAALLARRLFDDGAIGRLDHVRAFHGHPGGKDFGPAWIVDHAVTGGGTLMDNGIHMIDLARWFLGDVEEVAGYASNHTWNKVGCEDNGFLLLRNSEGKLGRVESSWTEWRGYGYRLEIYGTEGYIRLGYPPLWLTWAQGHPGERMRLRRHLFPVYQIRERLRGWRWSLIETLKLDLESWVQAIRAGRQPPASGVDGLEAVRIALSARRLSSENDGGGHLGASREEP
jgi:predicted dehydrogenase